MDYAKAIKEALTVLEWNKAGYGNATGDIQEIRVHPEIMKELNDELIKGGHIFGVPIKVNANLETFEIGVYALKRRVKKTGWSFWIFSNVTHKEVETERYTKWLSPCDILEKENADRFAEDELKFMS